jgi:hypothetical protein
MEGVTAQTRAERVNDLETQLLKRIYGGCGLLFRRIDPGGDRQGRRLRHTAFEASRVCVERSFEGDGALAGERSGIAVVHGGRGHQPDALRANDGQDT